MPKAEGMIFDFQDESGIRPELLETIDYDGNKQEILYDTDELSAVCPFSGLPDYGMLSIGYIPNKKIIELKSLKYYITSFRNVGIYQEALTNRIYNDLFNLLEPEFLRIETDYNTRGGINANCVMDSDMQN
ncbi:MAG: NADPH-dependent 7-cyano-7-deazaguanine reductase QueF [Candidatus Delongbacteria bacterium]|nr:NADPH-dependent 7-cyano-7-deazaguanine reductase QueF [Candidatus Delongbacteria bacterium]